MRFFAKKNFILVLIIKKMSNISLEASVRTCKVNTGWANRIQSDRFTNSNLLMCPVWNQRDLTGRSVCEDSFYTKREGCNSAMDRINVENDQRPQYAEYITLDTSGYRANMYGDVKPGVETYVRGMEKNMQEMEATQASNALDTVNKYTGQFGYVSGFRNTVEPACSIYPYEFAMASMAQQQRYQQGMSQGSKSESYRQSSQ
jgi:hypothetical protein